MTPERFRQIEDLYHAAREDRAVLAKADPDLRREVESLLAQDSLKTGMLDQAAWAGAVGLTSIDATLAAITPGTQLGPYKIEGSLGAGGMGEVFRALDTRLGRSVAIKITDKQFIARFEREARAISALNHPNICTLHDVGPNYLVMELCEGETLAARLKRGKLSLEDTLRYGAQIADALAAAHAKGIVHRDLKPSNVMVTKSGVKVLDFGLAKSSQDETITASRMVMGTPAYMAPEQREGKECDARTDIHALGLILSEMATGKRTSAGVAASLDQLPERLAHVIERCVAIDADERWQSVKDVTAELVWARKASSEVKLQTARRSRFSILRYVGISIVTGALVAGIWVEFARRDGMASGGASLPPDAALLTIASYTGTEKSGAISPDGKFFAFVSNRSGSPDIWVRQISGGDPVQVTHDEIGEQDLTYDSGGESIYYATTEYPPTIQRVSALGGTPQKLVASARYPAPSPDGKWLAYGTIGNSGYRELAKTIQVANTDGSHPQAIRQADGGLALQYLSWSPDGKWLAYCTGTLFSPYKIDIVDPSGKRQETLENFAAGRPYGIAWAADSNHIIYSYDAGPLGDHADIWMKPIDGGLKRRITLNPRGSFRSVSVSKDGERLLGSIENTDTEIWRVPLQRDPVSNAATAVRLLDSAWKPMWIQLSAGGALLFNSPATGERNLWSMSVHGSSGPRQITFQPGGQISHASISPNGNQLAFVSVASGNGQIWTANTDGSGLRQLTSDAPAKSWPFWSPDGKWIMFASQLPGSQQIWKVLAEGGPAEQFTKEGGLRGDWSPAGDRIAYDVNDNRVRIAEASSGKVLREVQKSNLSSPVWSPDGKLISAHGPASVWTIDPNSGDAKLAVQFPQDYRFTFRAAWMPDGRSVVVNKYMTTSQIVLLERF
jgi:Tol biopolymer transport system component